MRTAYHKLVRDHIPDLIRQSGKHCAVGALEEFDYRQALRQKLIEEGA